MRRNLFRNRLLVILVSLTVLGMAVIDGAALFVLHVYSTNRVDRMLVEVQDSLSWISGRAVSVQGGMTLEQQVPEGFLAAAVADDGRVLSQSRPYSLTGELVTAPPIPDPVPPGWAAEPITLSSPDTNFRVQMFDLGGRAEITLPDGSTVPFRYAIVAGSLTPGEDAIAQLLVIELIATGFAVIAVCVFGVVAFNRSFNAQQRTEERLREFIAAASHELRTPLTTIRGWAELHRVSGRAELADMALSRIEQEADRMNALVDQLLQLASLDQPGRSAPRDRVDLRGIAAETVADAAMLEPDRPIVLDAPDEVVVEGDENALRQVVRNLVSNAVKHTPAGTGISVTVREGELVVADRGPGMPAEVAGRVFDRFYRASEGGTGLGLSIVRDIVRAHGGKVILASEPGEGSRFTVLLPSVRSSSDS